MKRETGPMPHLPRSYTAAHLWLGVYVLIVAAPLIISTLARRSSGDPFLHELGKDMALSALMILFLQLVLVARLQPFSRPYGLDMTVRFHKAMAVFAALMLIAHPILMAPDLGWTLLYSPQKPWPIWLGRIALLLILLQIVFSLTRKALFRYEKWRLIHNQALLIWVLGWLHSYRIGPDLELTPLRLWWLLGLAALIAVYLYHKLYVPLTGRRRAWEVVDVKQETHNVWTLAFKPPAGVPHFSYWPGQFCFLTLYRNRPDDGEEHHFTISSSPTTSGIHTATIKQSGDFTATIGATRPGDKARVQGPYGRFSHVLYPEEKNLVFIAGGIGITPLMSMLRYMRDTQAAIEVLLLYGNRTVRDIVFADELAQMEREQAPRLRVVHFLSEPPEGWTGEWGYLTHDLLLHHCNGTIAGKGFYVCGPKPMMQAAGSIFRELGVPSKHIHMERFAL